MTTSTPNTVAEATPTVWPIIPLDPRQRAAATSPEAPTLILGGPGTGKSHTLTARVIELLKADIPAHCITVLTFSARAADNLKEQFANMETLPESISQLFISTMHAYASFFNRQAGAAILGISPHYTIWDREQCSTIIDQITNDPDAEAPRISREDINRLIAWHALNRNRDDTTPLPAPIGLWHQVVEEFDREKRRQNAMDFDDLAKYAIAAMQRNPEIRQLWSNIRSRHLLVDEFQDITPTQYMLVRLMVGPTQSITVFTDPNQAIYSWRGAEPNLINNFILDFPGANRHILTMNHRATANVASIATTLNTSPAMTGLTADHQSAIRIPGTPPQVISYDGPVTHLDTQVVDLITNLHDDKDHAWEDIAVIYRNRNSSDRLTTQLGNRNIPHTILGQQEESRDPETIALRYILSFSINPYDAMAMAKAAELQGSTRLAGVNARVLRDIIHDSRNNNCDLIQAARHVLETANPASSAFQNIQYVINAANVLRTEIQNPNATITSITRLARYQYYLHRKRNEPVFPNTQVQRFYTVADNYITRPGESLTQTLTRFLEEVTSSNEPEQRTLNTKDPYAHDAGVTLATFHASKGLQWRTVILIDCTDDVIPGAKENSTEEDLQEAQRLFYVAATRGVDNTYFFYATVDNKGRKTEPTRYLREIADIVETLDT